MAVNRTRLPDSLDGIQHCTAITHCRSGGNA